MLTPHKFYQTGIACLFAFSLLLLLNFATPVASAQEPAGSALPVIVFGEVNGDIETAAVPARVPFAGVRKVAMGQFGGCLITLVDDLLCWGAGTQGQNGDGVNTNRLMPTRVPFFSGNVIDVSRDLAHACAVRNDGTVWCWGDDSVGQLGNGAGGSSPTPVQVTGISSAVGVDVYRNTSCAHLSDGTAKCWGSNDHNRLGNTLAPMVAQVPYFVAALDDVIDITVGYDHVCALEADGIAYCWGDDGSGQLGNGGSGSQNLPGAVIQITNFTQISAGAFYTCGLRANGSAYCWGSNNNGQLGDGTNLPQQAPEPVESLGVGVAQIEAGAATACARLLDSSMRCWGLGSAWSLGNGSAVDSDVPVSVSMLGNNVASMGLGVYEACAVAHDATLYCWGGANETGAMGNGSNAYNVLPALVVRPATCYLLSLAASSGGDAPVADDNRSDGCPLAHYVQGEVIQLAGRPTSNLFRVQSWTGGVAGAPGANLGVLRMPTADITVTVNYAACRLLTRTHTGNGGDPTASFGNSVGCPAGRYAPGEVVQLAATPSQSQRVQAWSGTSIAPGAALPVNSMTMPNADHTVGVTYEACFALSVAALGDGDIPGVYPAASNGCAAGTFVAGEAIQFTANPAPGWGVAGWLGTDADSSTAALNSLTMPAGERTVTVTYEQGGASLYLPLVGR